MLPLIGVAAVAAAPELSAAFIAALASGGTALTAGLYYLLATPPNAAPDKPTLVDLATEVKDKQQQPLMCAKAMQKKMIERHDTLLSQGAEQQEAIAVSIVELDHAAGHTTALATKLSHLVPALNSLATEAALDVQTMHETTADVCEQLVTSNQELQNIELDLKEEEKQFATVLDDLSTVVNTLPKSHSIEQKIRELSSVQQQTGSAQNSEALVIENTLLKQQVHDLQTQAADTRELLVELLEENDTLKKEIRSHQPQRNTPTMTMFGHA